MYNPVKYLKELGQGFKREWKEETSGLPNPIYWMAFTYGGIYGATSFVTNGIMPELNEALNNVETRLFLLVAPTVIWTVATGLAGRRRIKNEGLEGKIENGQGNPIKV